MFNKIDNKPVKIGILEISTQNKAILEFFFESAGKTLFKEVSLAEADAFIIDYDFPGAKESWENMFNSSGKPGIILSIHEVSMDSAIWVSKPLTAQALTEAGQKLKQILQEDKQAKEKPGSSQSSPEKKVSDKTVTEITPQSPQPNPASATQNEAPDTSIESMLDNTLAESFALTANQEIGATTSLTNPETSAEFIDVNADIEFSPQEVMDYSIPKQTNDPAPVLESPEPVDFLSAESPDKAARKTTHKIRIPSTPNEPFGAEPTASETDNDLLHQKAGTNDNNKAHEKLETPGTLKDADSIISNQEAVNNKIHDIELPIENDVASNNEEMDALLESLIAGKGTSPDTDTNKYSPENPKETNNDTDFKLEELLIEQPKNPAPSFIEENEQRSTEDLVSLPEESFSSSILKVSADGTSLADDKNPDAIGAEKEAEKVASIKPKNMADTPVTDKTDNLNNNKASPKKHTPVNKHTKKPATVKQASIGATSKKPSQPNLDKSKLDARKAGSNKPKDSNASTIIKEPLSAEEELQRLLDEIRKEADTKSDLTGDAGKQTKTTFSEKRGELVFGNRPIINKPADLKKLSFKPEEHILQTFMQALGQAKASQAVMRLKFKNIIIVIDIKQEAVYCDFSLMDEEYAKICFNTIDPGIIKIHTLDKSEIRLYRKKMSEEPENTHSFEAFIWTTSLLTARGRLPENTDINQKIGIKYWPNLTRLESIPHAIQIAAVLKKHPGSLLEVPHWLNLPQSAVFAFYNGVLSLDIIETDQRKLNSLKKFNKKSNKKNRGFLSRLLKRITR